MADAPEHVLLQTTDLQPHQASIPTAIPTRKRPDLDTRACLCEAVCLCQSFKYALTAGPRHWGVAIPRDPFTLLNFNLSHSPVYTAFLRHVVDLVRQGRKVLVFAIHPWVQLYVFLRPARPSATAKASCKHLYQPGCVAKR